MTNGSTTSMFVAGNITIGELFTRVLPRLKKEGIEGKSGEEWMLKMPGKEVFLFFFFYFSRLFSLIYIYLLFFFFFFF